MSARKRLAAPISTTSSTALARVISLADLENAHKTPDKVKKIFIESLGGIVYSRPVSAKVVTSFLDMASQKEDTSQGEFINVLSEFAYAALCNEDGSDFMPSPEHAKNFSVEVLSEICAGIAAGGSGESKRKKGSRR